MGPSLAGGHITRRETLKTAAAFMIPPAGLARGYAADEKLNIGVIGIGGIGWTNVAALDRLGENIAALCDVDSGILEGRGARYPKAVWSEFAGKQLSERPACSRTREPGSCCRTWGTSVPSKANCRPRPAWRALWLAA